MKKRTKLMLLPVSIFLFCASCTPTVFYKSVTTKKNNDGSTTTTETEAVTQTINTNKKLTLEKIKLD